MPDRTTKSTGAAPKKAPEKTPAKPVDRSASAKAAAAKRTPKQRSEAAKKAIATMRANGRWATPTEKALRNSEISLSSCPAPKAKAKPTVAA